jgi:hypothetical protein
MVSIHYINNKLKRQFEDIHYLMCIWQLKNAVYGSMFFECEKPEDMQGMNKSLHIFRFLVA